MGPDHSIVGVHTINFIHGMADLTAQQGTDEYTGSRACDLAGSGSELSAQ